MVPLCQFFRETKSDVISIKIYIFVIFRADIAVIGLAVMGQNLILNMNDHGYVVCAYNRTPDKVTKFLSNEAKNTNVSWFFSSSNTILLFSQKNCVKMNRTFFSVKLSRRFLGPFSKQFVVYVRIKWISHLFEVFFLQQRSSKGSHAVWDFLQMAPFQKGVL